MRRWFSDSDREPTRWFWPLVYLVFPVLLFWAGWARLDIGLPLSLLLVATLLTVRSAPLPTTPGVCVASALFALSVLAIIGFVSGNYCSDWYKHWALLNLIGDTPWPTTALVNDHVWWLRFYVGAYLTPAFLHRAVPALSVKLAVALSFGLGYALVFGALVRANPEPAPRRRLGGAALAFLFGGADFYLANLARLLRGVDIHDVFGLHYEWWFTQITIIHPVQLSSLSTLMFWVPHQSIATVIVALMWATTRASGELRAPLLAYGVLSLWSPFGMIGLLPLVAYVLWQQRARLLEPATLLCAGAGFLCAVGVASYVATDPPPRTITPATIIQHLADYPDYLLFLAVELAPFLLVIRGRWRQEPVWVIALAILVLLPICEGQPSDFVMRASMGPLAILSLAAGRCLVDDLCAGRPWYGMAALVLCVPAIASEVVYHLQHATAYERIADNDPLNAITGKTFVRGEHIDMQEFFSSSGWEFVPYYLARERPWILRQRPP